MAVDLFFLPDQKSGKAASRGRADLSFLPDLAAKPDLSFLPDKPVDLDFLPDQVEPMVPGLFGTRVLENNKVLGVARMPAEGARKLSKFLFKYVPEPSTPSVGLNAVINTPKTLAEIGAEFGSSYLDPETLIAGGLGKGAQLFGKTKVAAKVLPKVGKFLGKQFPVVKKALTYDLANIPGVKPTVDFLKRNFTYKGLKPQ